MYKKILFPLIFFILLNCNLFAEGKILLSMGNTDLVVGQTTTLSVTLSNLKYDSNPEIRNISEFEVTFIGTSSNISIINGVYKSEKVYNYQITPKKKGVFEIGPAVVKIGGKEYKSNVVKVNVNTAPAKTSGNKNSKLFMEVSTDKDEVALNEEVNLIIKIYRRVNVFNMSIKPPDMNSFVVYKIGSPKDYEEVKNGKKYYVSELKYALFPMETGSLTIEPFILNGNVVFSGNPLDSFFRNPFVGGDSKRVSIPSNPVTIKVRPLNGNVYAVGDYDFSYSSNEHEVKVGQSVTVTFKVFGYGNLNLSENLKLPQVKGLKYYPDKPSVKIKERDNGVYSEKTEKIAIIPEKAGDYKIPEIPIIFFNPISGKYEKFNLPAINLKVFPSNRNNLKVVEQHVKTEVSVNKKDNIATIKPDVSLENENVVLSGGKILILFVLPLIIYLLMLLYRYLILVKKVNYKRNLKNAAFTNFKKSLTTASTVDEIADILQKYFTNRTENFNKSLTFDEIIKLLEVRGINKDEVESLKNIFVEIEKVRFARLSNVEIEKLKEILLKLIKSTDMKL